MKLKLIILFILLNSFFVSSNSINILNEDYVPGETFMANLFLEEEFKLSELTLINNESEKINIGILNFKKNENEYLIYFNVPNLDLKKYWLTYGEINDSFYVIESSKVLAVEPPIIKLLETKNDFTLKLINNGIETLDVEIISENSHINPVRDSINIPISDSRNLFVNYNSLDDGNLKLFYGNRSYDIEILGKEKIIEEEEEEEEEEIVLEGEFKVVDSEPIKQTISQNQIIEGSIEIINTYPIDLHNITFHPSLDLARIINFNVSMLEKIKPNETLSFYIWVNKNKNALPKFYDETLVIKTSEGYKTSLDFELNIIETILDEEIISEDKKNIDTEESFQVSPIDNFTIEGGIQIGGNEEDEDSLWFVGFIILLIVLIVSGILAWKLRPKKRVLKFRDYVKAIFKKNE